MQKRSLRFASLAVVMLLGAGARAQGLPELDRYQSAPPVAARASSAPLARNGAVASWDSQRGVPTFFWADRASSAALPALRANAGPEALARAFVAQHASLYGLSAEAQGTVYTRHVHDTGRGGVVVILGQRVDGAEVFETEMKVLLDRQGALVAIGGNLHGAAVPQGTRTTLAFAPGAASAIAVAASDMLGVLIDKAQISLLEKEKAGYRYYKVGPSPALSAKKLVLGAPVRAKKVYYPMPGGLVPAYYLEVNAGRANETTSDLYGYVIAADGSEILLRRHLVRDAAFKYRVWAEASAPFTPAWGPQADFAPHPTGLPDGSLPPFISPVLVTADGFNAAPGGGSDPCSRPRLS